ncbi:MAG TPA: polysaccharide biosynthesis/export family protein [Longimicrobiales bacterium]|nr:polysaccharide biosynthesis/export family protein [Longimicrobiales bacterium]
MTTRPLFSAAPIVFALGALISLSGPRAAAAQALAGAGGSATAPPPSASAAPARASAPLPGPESAVVLQAGDMVRIDVWRQPELSGEFRVGPDGMIQHPLYHAVRAAGRPFDQVSADLAGYVGGLLAQPQMIVQPLYRITVSGEVRQPNVYALTPETSVTQAIALAGGPTDRGRLDRVRLVRNGREIKLNLTRPESLRIGDVQSGDQLIVGRSGDVLRDYIGPLASAAAAIATVVGIAVRN